MKLCIGIDSRRDSANQDNPLVRCYMHRNSPVQEAAEMKRCGRETVRVF